MVTAVHHLSAWTPGSATQGPCLLYSASNSVCSLQHQQIGTCWSEQSGSLQACKACSHNDHAVYRSCCC